MKTCIFCEYWSFAKGTPEYSDYEPATGYSEECLKGKWDFSEIETTEQYRSVIMQAETCREFKPVKGKVK